MGRNLLRIIRAQNIQGLSKQTTSTQTKTIHNIKLFFFNGLKKLKYEKEIKLKSNKMLK